MWNVGEREEERVGSEKQQHSGGRRESPRTNCHWAFFFDAGTVVAINSKDLALRTKIRINLLPNLLHNVWIIELRFAIDPGFDLTFFKFKIAFILIKCPHS